MIGSPLKLWLGLAIGAVLSGVAILLVVLMVLVTAVAGPGLTPAQAANCLPPGVGLDPTPGGTPTTDKERRAEQIKNAKAIDAATVKAGFSGLASRIAIIAAYGESTMFNIDYGDQVNGVTNPDGSPATSFGLFQQQTSQGWGTKEQVMDPEYATTSFLTGQKHDGRGGLVSVLHWEETKWISSVIHQVQNNSDRDHYTRSIEPADAIIKEAGIDVTRAGKNGATVSAVPGGVTGEYPDECGGGSSGEVDPKNANDDYPFLAVTPPAGVYEIDPFGYYYGECTSFVSWRINRDAGSTKAPYKYSAGHGNFLNGDAAGWKEAWLARGWKVSTTPVAGAVAWWGAKGGPGIGTAGHVAYVQSVTADGKAIIEEYNNVGYAPPGHKYSMRKNPVEPADVNLFLYPPPKN